MRWFPVLWLLLSALLHALPALGAVLASIWIFTLANLVGPRLVAQIGGATLLLGLALPDSRMHAPNENFPLAHLDAGCRLNRALLVQLA